MSRSSIDRAARQIAERFSPKQIVLFGSYARGQATPDSDVDLLVLMDTSLRPVDQAVEIRGAVQFPFPVDLLVRTPGQIEERLSLGDSFIQEILAEGIVLYEAANAGMDRQS